MSDALDTNVLVRLATHDDPGQFKKAERLVRERFSRSTPAWISVIVLAEYAWVLGRLYEYSRGEIADSLIALLRVDCFRLEDANHVESAIRIFRGSKADFSDCLIVERNRERGSDLTHTFDRKAAKLEGFRLIT